MRRFDYSFLETGTVPVRFVNLASLIYDIRRKTEIQAGSHKNVFDSLSKVAKIHSVRDSNAIEGIATSEARLLSIVNGESEPLSHDEKEIAGYRDALNLIHTGQGNLRFDEETIKRLHRTMFSLTGEGGHYKTADNLIMEIDGSGRRKIRFRPMGAKETPMAMEQLALAYADASSNYGINKLLLIPCAILDFLCIHPFMDGNGRVSRLLSLLLMYENGFKVGKYISFEEQINQRKDEYYEALRLSSIDWEKGGNDYFPFVENFLSTLYRCYKELDDRIALLGDGKVSKKKRIENALANRIVPISKAGICELLPDVSPTTVEAVLGELLKAGKIKKIGSGRLTRYVGNPHP